MPSDPLCDGWWDRVLNPYDHYNALVESTDDAIIAKDLDSRIVSWNPAAERLFGYSADEMLGQSIRKLIPADRQQEEDQILAKITAGERFGQFVTERIHKDGHLVSVFITVSPVIDESGTIVGASKIARDASGFVAHQRKIEESEARFRLLADNISQFAWIASADGQLTWYNKRWFDYTGTTLEEMKGWGWTKVHHPAHVDRVVAHIQHSWDTGEEWEDLFPLRSRDGEYRWFLSRAVPIRDEHGQIVQWFGTNTDITEQREQAEQVRLLMREVDHRSKNLLTTVQALARRTADADTDFADRFEQRLQGLATNQDLLVKGQWREVELMELVRRQLDFVGHSNGQLEISGPDVALTDGAAEVIGMAIHELATNSLKYGALSEPTGKVAIEWQTGDKPLALRMWWREQGGPTVSEPARKGFGTTLICDVPRLKLHGKAQIDYCPEGVRWTLEADEVLSQPAASHITA